MAAVATQKPNGAFGVQLTFPKIFAQNFDAGFAYFPTAEGMALDLMTGSTFQSEYHDQKMREARQSVMNGIQNNKTKERKLLTGVHNYHLPKPVLGQRKFAPPVGGVGDYSSARRDGDFGSPFQTVEVGAVSGSGLRGGVMASLEGQNFYQDRLKARLGELDNINTLSLGYAVPMGQKVDTQNNRTEGSPNKVELFTYLQALSDSILEADLSKFTFENLIKVLKLLFATAPTADMDTMNDIQANVNTMAVNIRGFMGPREAEFQINDSDEYVLTLQVFLDKMVKYVANMIRNIDYSEKDKKTLSNSLIKSLGFTSLIRKGSPAGVVSEARLTSQRVNQAAEDFDDGDEGNFDRPAQSREDGEAGGVPSAPFAGRAGDPNRVRFGSTTGRVVHGEAAYFGDADVPVEVQPLSLAGFDSNAEIPEADTSSLKEAVESAMDEVKYSGFFDLTEADEGKDIETLIREQGRSEEEFIAEIEAALSPNHSKPQIAKGMELVGLPMFQSYITENLAEGLVPPQQRNIRPTAVPPPVQRVGDRFPSDLDELAEYNTKTKLKDLWNSIPIAMKTGVAKPHGNSSIATYQRRIAEALGIAP
jgi:hypothetical protein